jgi:hypothetical protein
LNGFVSKGTSVTPEISTHQILLQAPSLLQDFGKISTLPKF